MAETTTYQCPNCNGRLIFDGSIGKLRCEFCESEFTTAEVEALYAEKQAQADAKVTSGIDNKDAYNRALRLASEAGIDVEHLSEAQKKAAYETYRKSFARGKAESEIKGELIAAVAAAADAPAAGATAAQASTYEAAQVKPTKPLTGDPIKDYIAQSKWSSADVENMRAYNCPSCGAQLMVDQVTAVTSCPYCGNNAVVPGQLADVLKPDYVIPFKLDRNAAISALRQYYGGKPLLPNDFTANNHIEEIQGIYVPFWLYSGTGEGNVRFEGRNIRTWSDSKNIYTETDHYDVHRVGSMKFARVPVDGSTKMPDAHMDAIEPYDYSELVPFSVAYLPGFLTDRYDLDVEQCDARARGRVETTCLDVIEGTAGNYMETNVTDSSTHINWTDITYALLPVWMLHTRWNGEDYLFAMNGQTGKFIGDLPVDNGKARKRFLMLFLPLMVIIAAIIFFVFGFGL